jgi:hypothetical protein
MDPPAPFAEVSQQKAAVLNSEQKSERVSKKARIDASDASGSKAKAEDAAKSDQPKSWKDVEHEVDEETVRLIRS